MKKRSIKIAMSLLPAVIMMVLAGCYNESTIGGDAEDDGQPDPDGIADEVTPDPAQDESRPEAPPDETPPPPSPAVDILVVVDNSGSMTEEQENLRSAMPTLIQALLNPPVDPVSGTRLHEPIRDIHVGVVSTDMGVAGYSVQTCEIDPAVGDDGLLQNVSRGEGCDASYPSFLSYQIAQSAEPDGGVVSELAADFGCVAVLGTDGCGFEQQLEAAHKALVVHGAPGGANAPFLREEALLLVLFVTDEEDCSAADPALFDVSGLSYSINLRCFYEPGMLHPVERYVAGLQGLKSDPARVIVGIIAGVPLRPVCNGRGDEIGDCLAAAEMQETVRPDGEMLEHSCKFPAECTPPASGNPGDCATLAYPPRRLVQLAQGLGGNGFVTSICTGNYGPPMDALAQRVVEVLGL